jgi:hypothetical protein
MIPPSRQSHWNLSLRRYKLLILDRRWAARVTFGTRALVAQHIEERNQRDEDK